MIKFIDFQTQYRRIKENLLPQIENFLESGNYIMGKQVYDLEEQLSKYVGRKYCLTCASGTDALLIPLMALDIGINDAVFVPSFTFFATAESVSLVGATPVFVDIEPDSFNIDPINLEYQIEKIIKGNKLTPKAIIPVNLFGVIADYNKIYSIAEKYNLFIIEDAAQSFGSTLDHKKSCSFGNVSATSFYPAKPFGCYGEGGAIFTDEEDLYNRMYSIRVHGQGIDRYVNERIGLNARFDTFQAIILLEKLKIFDDEFNQRRIIAKKYSNSIKTLKCPVEPDNQKISWAQYSVLADSKDHREFYLNILKEKGVPTGIYYPIPLHLQKAYEFLGYKKGDLHISEDLADRIFSLPIHPYMNDEEINYIVEILNN